MSRPGVQQPVTSRSPKRTLYQLSYRGRLISDRNNAYRQWQRCFSTKYILGKLTLENTALLFKFAYEAHWSVNVFHCWNGKCILHGNSYVTCQLSYRIYNNWDATWQNQQSDSAPSEDSDQPGHPQSLISLRCPHEERLGSYLPIERTAKTLIRLGGCPGWSESSLGAHSFCWFCHVVAHILKEIPKLFHRKRWKHKHFNEYECWKHRHLQSVKHEWKYWGWCSSSRKCRSIQHDSTKYFGTCRQM